MDTKKEKVRVYNDFILASSSSGRITGPDGKVYNRPTRSFTWGVGQYLTDGTHIALLGDGTIHQAASAEKLLNVLNDLYKGPGGDSAGLNFRSCICTTIEFELNRLGMDEFEQKARLTFAVNQALSAINNPGVPVDFTSIMKESLGEKIKV